MQEEDPGCAIFLCTISFPTLVIITTHHATRAPPPRAHLHVVLLGPALRRILFRLQSTPTSPPPRKPHPIQVTMATEARLDADVNVLTKKDNQRITWSM